MRAPLVLVVFVAAACAPRRAAERSEPREHEAENEHGRALFDGRTLDGWDGDPRYWSVEDGAIVGRSTKENPLTESTYLVWRGGTVADFELELDYRIRGGNSGVQFRSVESAKWNVAGYQADIEDGPSWTGCLYEQDGRGVVATRGERVHATKAKRESVRLFDAAELQRVVRPNDWNHYAIRARGNAIELSINGERTVELVDDDAEHARASGMLALQLHQGAPMQVEVKNLRLVELAPRATAPSRSTTVRTKGPDFDGPKPQWIWTGADPPEHDVATFARAFELREAPKRAMLRATADNGLRVFVNGALVAEHDAWETHVAVDIAKLLHAGKNELAFVAKNDGGPAGAWAELVADGEHGRALRLISDASFGAERPPASVAFDAWTPKDFDASRASAPHVAGTYGCAPWGTQAGSTSTDEDSRALDASKLELAPGFRAELLYSVPKATQGSWIALCVDARGRFIVSDQTGKLFRVSVTTTVDVEPVDVDLGRAHGMCWAFDVLYVVVGESGGPRPMGLYRVTDTNGDDRLDRVELLRGFDGGGEHGPHAVVLGPDRALYVVAGNFTTLPGLARSRVPKLWAEDELLPHLADPNDHDPTIMAPGGWVCRTDRDAREWELVACGLRNSYDVAFDEQGELFTFDSDMEWDVGAPWYRPTRVLHLVSGADFGWRNGSAKWSATWPDTLPSVCDLGLSSPTAVVFGTSASFPLKYRGALFACDWAYGTIYTVFPEARGSSFGAKHEVFARGKPFPVTDAVIGADGAMYVTTGGRGTQSGFYRIAWDGPIAQDIDARLRQRAIDMGEAPKLRAKRHDLESADLSREGVTKDDVARVARELTSADPFVRNAARVAFERAGKLDPACDPHAVATLVARLRLEGPACRDDVLRALSEIDLARATGPELVELLRVHQLFLLRCAPIDEATRAAIAERLLPLFATSSGEARSELARVLGGCGAPAAIEPLLAFFASASTQEEKIHAAHCLLAIRAGWTGEQRAKQFALLDALIAEAHGGASLVKFVERIRRDALAQLPDEERARFAPKKAATSSTSTAASPRVHAWTKDELVELLRSPDAVDSTERGRAAFTKARCADCHRVAGAGGDTGPDLTGAGARFSRTDLVEALLEPSKVISDQFRDVELATKDGDLHVGRIEKETATTITLRRLPPEEDLVEIDEADVEERRFHPWSRMPAGLLDVLDANEVKTLVAYVLGDAHAK